MASAAAAGATNDKTGSIFITKSGFDAAASENKLDANLAAALWATLANSSSQRIIGGATAPRDDAANVNQWHWSEVDLLPWAKERFEELLVGKIEAHGVPDKGWVKINKMEHCKGEASVSNRKGKKIVAFELELKLKWEGQVDFDDVSGEMLLPYVSEDVTWDQMEVKLTAKESGDPSHKRALQFLQKEMPVVREALKTFTEEIYLK